MLTKKFLTLRFSPPVASTPLSPVRLCFLPENNNIKNNNNIGNSNSDKLLVSSSTYVNRKPVLCFIPHIVTNNNVPLSHSFSYHLNSLRNLQTRGLTRHFVANTSKLKSVTNSSCSSLECSSIVGNVSDKHIEIKKKLFQV